MHTPSIAFWQLPLWGRDVVNQRLKFAINVHSKHRFLAGYSLEEGCRKQRLEFAIYAVKAAVSFVVLICTTTETQGCAP